MKHSFKKVVIFLMILIGIIILIPRTAFNTDITTSKNKEKPIIRKTYIPELLVDCRKGDSDDNYSMFFPLGILTDSNGNIYVLDCKNNRIVKYNGNIKHLKSFGEMGRGPGQFRLGIGTARFNIAIDNNDILYLLDDRNFRVNIYSKELKFLRSFPIAMYEFFSIAIDRNKNIYLSKNPSPYTETGDFYTIYKYEKDKDGYRFVKGFSKSLAWTPRKNMSMFEHGTILNLSRSIIKVGPDDAIYQLFYLLPLIRKYDHTGNLIYQKIVAPEILKEEGWKESDFQNILNLDKASSEQILSQKQFNAFQAFCINKKDNTLMLLLQSKKILELDSNCNSIGLLIPDEKLSNLSDSNDDEYCSNLNRGVYSFTHDKKSGRLLFLSWNSGEIWAGYF